MIAYLSGVAPSRLRYTTVSPLDTEREREPAGLTHRSAGGFVSWEGLVARHFQMGATLAVAALRIQGEDTAPLAHFMVSLHARLPVQRHGRDLLEFLIGVHGGLALARNESIVFYEDAAPYPGQTSGVGWVIWGTATAQINPSNAVGLFLQAGYRYQEITFYRKSDGDWKTRFAWDEVTLAAGVTLMY